MIAYNRQWLNALLVQKSAESWHKKSLLTDAQHQQIQEQYPVGFYSPNVFIRIGLGFFCYILLGACQSFFWVMAGIATDWNDMLPVMGTVCLLLGAGTLLALEYLIRTRHHYASGIDDVLLYAGIGQVIAGMLLFIANTDKPLPFFCLAFPFLAAGAIRYLDRLLTFLAYSCLLFIILLIVNEIPEMALYLLPFTGILFSAAAHWFAKKNQQRTDWQPWAGNLQVVEVLSLITLYLSGNYWMIQQSAEELFGFAQVPLAWFFWAFTFAMPVGFVFMGLRTKDRVLLWMGLGCLAFAVFTFRSYFHVLPLPTAATIAGALLFAVAYFSIQYLKKGKVLFTYAPDDTGKPLFVEAETLIIAQTFGNTSQTPENDLSFGGGKFGGGGAGGDY